MSNAWADLTLDDLNQMGISIEDFEQMLANDELPDINQPDYNSLGVLAPPSISKQADQWAQLAAYKEALADYAPPSPGERRQDRRFYMPDSEAFSYDAVNQANPYIRALLNTAISGAKPGPNQAFDVREFVFGKITDPEDEGYKKDDKGKTRLGKAVTSALPDFEYIADQFHAEDERWATTDPKERRALLREWLAGEAEANLAGSAPSVSRNLGFSDWALNRQPGEEYMFEGPGFDRPGSFSGGKGEPRVSLDPKYWGENRADGAQAQMTMGDFKTAYADTLAKQIGRDMKVGQRIADPERGGHWQLVANTPRLTPVEARRQRDMELAALRRKRERNAPSNRSWWRRNVADRFGALPNLGTLIR